MKNEASQTLKLALPIIIGELAQMALHLIDSAMVGAISYKQLAAAALVINAMNIPFVIGIGDDNFCFPNGFPCQWASGFAAGFALFV
ncbi:hypothetical protein MUK70_12955 [Dyadobacter chenwenxiniae]|uniref:hypothetical protein n=1 Tax=Dyadobacter chenwenxiniae TaxID=2906456 RepID=UPI001FD3D049|nr:hypothetical protein [Dyadobacter chenwenxiniae]UON85890.1 hypothetical protein MUK70_12955 [Dyadobacter chenwenxiniae]